MKTKTPAAGERQGRNLEIAFEVRSKVHSPTLPADQSVIASWTVDAELRVDVQRERAGRK